MKFFQLGGIVLLIIGLLIIGYALWSSYQIFTGQREIYSLFSSSEEALSSPETASPMAEQLEGILGQQLGNIIPAGAITRLLDLVAWSVLAWIFIIGGGKVSSLGIQLLRNTRKAEKS